MWFVLWDYMRMISIKKTHADNINGSNERFVILNSPIFFTHWCRAACAELKPHTYVRAAKFNRRREKKLKKFKGRTEIVERISNFPHKNRAAEIDVWTGLIKQCRS